MQRSLRVAARFLAPCSRTGFRRPALVCRISPSNWGLLPGAPALTRTDLSSARTTRLSGRTMAKVYIAVDGSPMGSSRLSQRDPLILFLPCRTFYLENCDIVGPLGKADKAS